MSARPLILAGRTLGSGSVLDQAIIAAELGYDEISLRVGPTADNQPFAPPGSELMRQVRGRLGDTGLYVLDAESVRLAPGSAADDFQSQIDGAAEVGAKYLITVSDDADEDRAADAMAALAEAAGASGVALALEFMAYVGVSSLLQANRILDRIGRADAVVLVDALHLARAGGGPADLAAIPPSRLRYVQICDGRAEPAMPLRDEARRDRLIPGDGALPLVELIRALPADAAVSVEVPSAALQARLGDRGLAAAALEATRRLVEAAG